MGTYSGLDGAPSPLPASELLLTSSNNLGVGKSFDLMYKVHGDLKVFVSSDCCAKPGAELLCAFFGYC